MVLFECLIDVVGVAYDSVVHTRVPNVDCPCHVPEHHDHSPMVAERAFSQEVRICARSEAEDICVVQVMQTIRRSVATRPLCLTASAALLTAEMEASVMEYRWPLIWVVASFHLDGGLRGLKHCTGMR